MPPVRYWVWARFICCITEAGAKQLGIHMAPIWWEFGEDFDTLKNKFIVLHGQTRYDNLVWFECLENQPGTVASITEAQARARAGA